MASLTEIEGIGPVFANKLQEAGVRSVEALLEQGATSKGRKELAARTGIGDTLILEWVNHADLFRLRGVGAEYADLLEAAGVDTVVELAHRNPENLYKKMEEVNSEKNLVNRLPTLTMVSNWIDDAKSLPRVVQY